MKVGAKVVGADKLARAFAEKTRDVAAAARNGVKDAAEITVQALREAAPRDTGDMAAGISAQEVRKGDVVEVIVGPAPEHELRALATQYGTRTQPAQRWMDEAADASREPAQAAIADAIKGAL